MIHSTLVRESNEKQRAIELNRCLNTFINPQLEQDRTRRAQAVSKSTPYLASSQHPKGQAKRDACAEDDRHLFRNEPSRPHMSPTLRDGGQSSLHERRDSLRALELEDVPEHNASEKSTFKRAVELLRVSLNVEDGGGVVFFDTTAASAETSLDRTNTPQAFNSKNKKHSASTTSTCYPPLLDVQFSISDPDTNFLLRASRRFRRSARRIIDWCQEREC